MKFFGNKTLYSIFTGFVLVFLVVGVVCMSPVTYENMMSQDCPVAMNDMGSKACSKTPDNNICVNYHLGIIQSFSNAIPGNLNFGLFNFLALAVLALVALGLTPDSYSYYYRLKSRLKQLLEETIGSFQDQLGFWLTIIQKKDPSNAFALV